MIKKETLSDLSDSDICIENVFYMQLVTACDELPKSFLDVFEFDGDNVLKALGLDCSLMDQSDDELLEFLHDKAPKGILIRFATPVPHDFSFNSEGDWWAYEGAWDRRSHLYSYGASLEEALNNAIKEQDAFTDENASWEKKRLSA